MPSLSETTVATLVKQVRTSAPADLPDRVAELFEKFIPSLPAALRATLIEAVKWSQPFATNAWWKALWQELGVAVVGDLRTAGGRLAATKGVGRTKLLALVQDLEQMGRGLRGLASVPFDEDRAVDTIKRSLREIEHGPPSPHPFEVQSLFQALIHVLPPEVKAWELKSVPWTSEWLYTTPLWKALGITTVAELKGVPVELCRTRGIGRGKIVALAHELIFFSPELHARLRKAMPPAQREGARTRRGAAAARHRSRPASLVGAIDRLAERLSDRERDVLRRRIGWRYNRRPEKLRVLAEDHGVTQERVRQVEQQVRKRMLRLMRIRNFPARLREALRGRPGPVELAQIVACGPGEFEGMMDVWRPLASLLHGEGGPFLYDDPWGEGRVLVSASPHFRRPQLTARRLVAEPQVSWPSRTPPTPRY